MDRVDWRFVEDLPQHTSSLPGVSTSPSAISWSTYNVSGYAAFFAWCIVVGLALSALSLLRLGRLAGRAHPIG